MECRKYALGLINNPSLFVDANGNFFYQEFNNTHFIELYCNVNDNSVIILQRGISDRMVNNINENEMQKGVKMQLDEDGSRWEGDWYTEKPFGFGSFYDGEGNRVYSGFVYDGKKVGYGTEYFADSHTVDYCGNFLNNLRHGWGTTYNKNGQKLYEGDWRLGRNCGFEDTIEVEDNCDYSLEIHDWIKELIVGKNCFNSLRWSGDLVIEKYPILEKIIVKNNSLRNLHSLKICNCEELKTIETEESAFHNVNSVIIESSPEMII